MKFPKFTIPMLKFSRTPLRSRRKNLLTLVLIGIVLVLAYQFALEPLLDSQKKVQDEIVLKKKMLTRYLEFIKSGKEVEDGLSQMVQRVEAIQSKLLPGETPRSMRPTSGDPEETFGEKWNSDTKLRIGEPRRRPTM